MDQALTVNGQTQRHQVNGLSGRNRLGAQLQIVRFGVCQGALDVNQAIVALKALALDGPQVDRFALHRCGCGRTGFGGNRHGEPRSVKAKHNKLAQTHALANLG